MDRPAHPLSARPARPPAGDRAARLAAELDAWAAGRSALLRAPLLLYLAWVGVRQFADPDGYSSLVGALNLGVHEAGHLVFRPFGLTAMVLGGSLLQCAAPLAALWMFRRQPDFFAMAVALAWLATNLVGIGGYMADAEAMAKTLVTVGGREPAVPHDWRHLFGRWDVLDRCEAIGAATRGLGHAAMAAALAGGAWLLVRMARRSRPA